MKTWILLAIGWDDDVPLFPGMTPALREQLIMFGTLLTVILLATIWFVVRGRRRRRHSHQNQNTPLPATVEGQSHHWRHRHKHRRHHGGDFKPNPTLAETGGLPPKREPAPLNPPKPTAPPQQA